MARGKTLSAARRVARVAMLLVKLGGSVLTDKARLRTARRTAIRRLASELAAVRQSLLVVHGAGSYGHILARRHQLNQGGVSVAKRIAASRVQQDVKELDGLVVNALLDVGIAAIPIAPSAVLSLNDGTVATADLTPFREFASMGFTPVTFGDVVRDLHRGIAVCSGDVMMLELARAFRPERAIFATDVDGLFTADPKRRRDASLLEVARPQDLDRIEFSSASRTDVTGSIEGKLRRMFEIADHVGECLIVNGNVKNRVRDALRGRRVDGTLAKAAAEVGVAMGVGSQRAALEKPELEPTYAVVKDYGVPLVFANLGAPQLVPQEGKRAYGVADARKAINMIDADAIIIHLNFLQEVVQPEGDRRAKGCLSAIKALASKFPLMAKETGAGISRETAQKLKASGARAIDVGGLGGTSFSAVEHYRARKEAASLKERLGATFWNWGIPTPASILLADVGLPLVATGGVRSGLDVAKGIALGATMAGMAKPMLEAARVSADPAVQELRAVVEELKAAMFLPGSTSIDAVQERPVIVSPPTASWLEAGEA